MDAATAGALGEKVAQAPQAPQEAQGDGRRGPAVRRQLLLAFVANLTTLGAGLSLGFSAVALPAMRAPDAAPHVSVDEASWIASVAAIATPLGCLASGPLLDRWGRRGALLAVNVPCLLGWLALGCAPHAAGPGPADAAFLAQMYAGRALTGVATGMASVPATVYAAEVAEPGLRGLLVTWTSAAISLGVLIVYLLGWGMQEQWRRVALWCACAPAAAGLLALLLPESPVWLAAKGRLPAAETALRRARAVPSPAPTPPALRLELDAAAAAAAETRRRAHAGAGGGGLWAVWTTLRAPATLKPLLILNAFFFFQQLSGVFVVIFYAVDVAREAGVALDAYLASVLIGAARVVVTIFTGFASQRFGRRPPALVSGAGMAACAAALGLWLWLARPEAAPSPPASPADLDLALVPVPDVELPLDTAAAAPPASWLPVTALLLYIATSTVGFLTLPWAMLGELFPARARGLAGGLTTCMAYLFSFFMLKLYPSMLDAMGSAGLFFFYGAAALAGTLFVAACLPETRGRTLQEIEDMFSGNQPPPAAKGDTLKAADDAELQPLQRAS